MQDKIWDVGVVGAGAAGLMTAILCAEKSCKVLLLEKRPRIGSKILISGGSRCNITHVPVSDRDYYTSSKGRTLRNVLCGFTPSQVMAFFRTLGVEILIDEAGQCWPQSNSSRTVVDVFEQRVSELGVMLCLRQEVKRLQKTPDGFEIVTADQKYAVKHTVICTGGMSFPETGSSGDGYVFARAMGHSVVTPVPALTPLVTLDSDWHSLSGISLSCRLKIKEGTRLLCERTGDFLFTHLGFSGPVVLSLSRFFSQKLARAIQLFADFLPQETIAQTRERWIRDVKTSPKVLLKNFMARVLPLRFVEVLMLKTGLSGSLVLNQCTAHDRDRLISSIHAQLLPVSETLGFDRAEVTAGGVSLDELNAKSLESKIMPGLFFAGEVVDVDGPVGGYNFQWAWASARAVSMAVCDRV